MSMFGDGMVTMTKFEATVALSAAVMRLDVNFIFASLSDVSS